MKHNLPKGTFPLAAKIYKEKYMLGEKQTIEKITAARLTCRYYYGVHKNTILAVEEAEQILREQQVEAMRVKLRVQQRYKLRG